MSHEGRTEDEAAIVRLLTTYARAADRMDASLLEGIFAPGAEIDLGQIYRGGPDGFTPVVMGFMGSMAATRHALTNPLVVFHGPDRAGPRTSSAL